MSPESGPDPTTPKQFPKPFLDDSSPQRRQPTMATPYQSSGSGDPDAAPNKERPVRVVRMRNIRGNICANRLPSGQLVYNVTIDRLWRADDQINDGGEVIKKGEWHQSQSFGRDDLLLVAKVADFCHTWIYPVVSRILGARHNLLIFSDLRKPRNGCQPIQAAVSGTQERPCSINER